MTQVSENSPQCKICGQDSADEFVKSEARSILKCRQCTLLWVHPMPTQENIRRLFEEEYITNDQRVAEDFTNYRISSLKREAGIIRSFRPNGGKLLDLGTASGAFLGCFKGFEPWEVQGLEPSRFSAQAAANQHQVQVFQGFLRDQKFSDNTYDVITSLDAFFFHPEPREDMAEIARILKPKGLFAVEIPGLRFRLLKNTGIISRLLYGVPVRLNAGVHLFYYSRETLGLLASQFGFQEVGAYAEQSPLYGNPVFRSLNHAYFQITRLLYRLSWGRLNLAPKEFIIYRLSK